MDNQDQERERGITILAKNLAVMRNGVKINIMDTPGHADFGGEVERVLNMCDGVLLVVDSVEGPKPQTRFVLDKALSKGMKALVVVNKIDRPAARPDYVVDKVFDLFVELNASDEQTDFRVVYASGLLGKAGENPDELDDDMGPLFDAVMEAIDPPKFESDKKDDLQALVSNIDYDAFKGKMGVARITNGSISKGQAVALGRPDKPKKTGRLELDRNVALQVRETDSADRYEVSGRGQLHLTVLIETMRREGFELEVGPPSVILKVNEETGQEEEPWEAVEVRVPEEFVGGVVDLFNQRKGELQDMGLEEGEGMNVIKYVIPTRGMLGLKSALLTATKGTAIIDSVFDSYRARIPGDIQARDKGSLLAFADGTATTFGLEGAQDRGRLMISPGDDVYKGMIVGVHQRPSDLEVNVCKTKQLTNMRSANKGITVGIQGAIDMTLDSCVEYIAADEILEVTPTQFRMAKNPDMQGKKGKK